MKKVTKRKPDPLDRHADITETKNLKIDLKPLEKLVQAYMKRDGSAAQSALRDIMTDCRHLIDKKNYDQFDMKLNSDEVYLEEREEP